jgi:hypothetical protein
VLPCPLSLQAAAAVQVSKKEEQALLEQIRKAFNAKHVVRVCSMYESERVLDGARRLLEAAEVIRQTVDLSGASLAIDDCYEVWGSGFISIPYDFNLQELQPQLVRLLGSGRPDSPGAAAAAAAAAAAGASTSGSSSSSGAYSAAAASRTSRGASSSGSGSSIRERWQEHQARQQQQQQPRSSLTPSGPRGVVSSRHHSSHSSQQPRAVPARAVGPVPELRSWVGLGRSAAAVAGAAARRVGTSSSSQQRRVQRCAAVRL